MTDFHFRHALIPEGWRRDVRIQVAAGRIAAIACDVPARPGDIRHGHVLPGLPNLHSHAFQRAMAGRAERRGSGADTFWSWRETMYDVALRLSPDDVAAVAAQAYVEMLEAGFTRVGEFHYLHHDRDGRPYSDPAELAVRIVAAAAETGIGLTLLPVAYARSGFGGAPTSAAQRRFACDLDLFARVLAGARTAASRHPGSVVGVAPHSLRAVTAEELAAVVAMAGDGPIHIHVAEQVREVEDCLAFSGQRPVEYLLGHAAVDARWCLIHATHMTDAEIAAVAARGAVAGLCPVTEANLGDGIFAAPAFLAAGGAIGIGTDSNVAIDAAGELRLLEYSQRLNLRQRNVLAPPEGSTGRSLVAAVLAGGGRALAAPAGLVVGASADVVTLRDDHPAWPGLSGDALLDGWIFAAGRDLVDCVIVRGETVVANGQHRARDTVARRYRAAMERLFAA
jgi:formiminoglutamate deiminase